MRKYLLILAGLVLSFALTSTASVLGLPGTTKFVSTSPNGQLANGPCYDQTISLDGRFVVFTSSATNLVPGDTNQFSDVFVTDLVMGTTERVNVSSTGVQANADTTTGINISKDGRYVVYCSNASNLVEGDTNDLSDIFVFDRLTKQTTLVSVSTNGQQASGMGDPYISADGKRVLFQSDSPVLNINNSSANNVSHLFVRDLATKITQRVDISETTDFSYIYSYKLSEDGLKVIFAASLPIDQYTGQVNIYQRDLTLGITKLIIKDNNFFSISSNGRFIAFYSYSTSAGAGIEIYDDLTGEIKRVATIPTNSYSYFTLSADGTTLAYGYHNPDRYYADIVDLTGSKEKETLALGYVNSDNEKFTISGDGKIICFYSSYWTPQISINDRTRLGTSLAASGPQFAQVNHQIKYSAFLKPIESEEILKNKIINLMINDKVYQAETNNEGIAEFDLGLFKATGKYEYRIYFSGDEQYSPSAKLGSLQVTEDFVGTTERISVSGTGEQGNQESGGFFGIATSADGRYVAFSSAADNLIPGDNNGKTDVFVKDRITGKVDLISKINIDGQYNSNSSDISMSSDGRYIVFTLYCYSAEQGYDISQVFWYDRSTGQTKNITVTPDGQPANGECDRPFISDDGNYVVFESYSNNLVEGLNTNDQIDNVYLYNVTTGKTELVSKALDGNGGNNYSTRPRISGNGKFIVFQSTADNLVLDDTNESEDIFIKDLTLGTLKVLKTPQGELFNQRSQGAGINKDGRFIVFSSQATNILPLDDYTVNELEDPYFASGRNIYLYDTLNNSFELINISINGKELISTGYSQYPYVSDDGRLVVFSGIGDSKVPVEKSYDLSPFIRDRHMGKTYFPGATIPNEAVWRPILSSSGNTLIYKTNANNLVPGDTNGVEDVFAYNTGIKAVTDDKAPTTKALVEGKTGNNSWYVSDVTVSLIATDNAGNEGIKTEYSFNGTDWLNYTTPISVTKEGNTKIYYRSTDAAGNVETTQTTIVNIDKTLPQIFNYSPAADQTFIVGTYAKVDWKVTDDGSGIAEVIATEPVGNILNTTIPGLKTFTITATDKAGNVLTKVINYQVTYNFSGVLAPLKGDGTDILKAGRNLPVKFQLKNATDNFYGKAVAKLYADQLVNGKAISTIVPQPKGSSNELNIFKYDLSTNQYTYNLDTSLLKPGFWALRIVLDDGTVKIINIQIVN